MLTGGFFQKKGKAMKEEIKNETVEAIKVFDNNENETAEETTTTDALKVNGENADEIIASGKGVFELSKPINIDGKKSNSIYFDLSSVSAIRYRNLVKTIERKNRTQIMQPAADIDVQIAVFSEASGIPVAVLKSDLSMKDMNQICTVVYAFLVA